MLRSRAQAADRQAATRVDYEIESGRHRRRHAVSRPAYGRGSGAQGPVLGLIAHASRCEIRMDPSSVMVSPGCARLSTRSHQGRRTLRKCRPQ